MTLLITAMFLLTVFAILLLFNLSPAEIMVEIEALRGRKKPTLKKMIGDAKKPKRLWGPRALVAETREVLRITGRSAQFAYLCIAAFAAAAVGGLAAYNWGTLLLIPILALACGLLPFLYIIFSKARLLKDMNLYLETSLAMVTSSYMRTGEITSAVRENIDHLPPPMDQIFREFLADTDVIFDMRKCLENLRLKVDNDIFREWVDTLISCQKDKALRGSLLRIVEKYTEIRYITGELENMLYDPIKEFAIMAAILVANIPFIYLLDPDWYEMLVHTLPGQIILAAYIAVILIGAIQVIRLCRPLDYYC